MAKAAKQMIVMPAPRLAAPATEEDWLALHPMHQRLVAEFETAGTADAPLSPAARLSAIFYLATGGWAIAAVVAWSVAQVI